jgi:ribosome-associated protein
MTTPDGEPTPHDEGARHLALGARAWVAPEHLAFRFIRSGGPGGQNVNKVSTAAELRVALVNLQGLDEAALRRLRDLAGRRINNADELVLRAETSRSQRENREICLGKLRDLVAAAATRPKVRRPTKPTRGARERRLEAKSARSRIKQARRGPIE